MTKFKSLITKAGAEKIAAAAVDGEKAGFTQMAVGDGAGALPVPDENQTALINECFRTQLNSLKVVDSDKNIIAAEMIIPPQVGGFTMREAALFDDDGVCLAVANMAETYKPLLDEGSGRFSIIRIWLSVSSTENVELITDPGVVLATIEDITEVKNAALDYADEQIDEHAKSRNHPDATLEAKGFTQLSNATDSQDQDKAATPLAVKKAYDLAASKATFGDIYPPGISIFFATNLNPNEQWPGTTWHYTGENKTIRLGKQDGSDVLTSGGSDTITIGKNNLPNVQIDVSGTAESFDLGTLDTTGAGGHTHRGKSAESNTSIDGGSSNRRSWANDYGYSDEELIEPVEDHIHQVDIPPHEHTVSGKTAALGAGESVGVTNSYIKLMCWYRAA